MYKKNCKMVDQENSNAGGDREWILEIIQDYLMSPVWKNPIVNFVEENCIYFEEGEENSLEHTEIHNRFKSLIEKNLEAFI